MTKNSQSENNQNLLLTAVIITLFLMISIAGFNLGYNQGFQEGVNMTMEKMSRQEKSRNSSALLKEREKQQKQFEKTMYEINH